MWELIFAIAVNVILIPAMAMGNGVPETPQEIQPDMEAIHKDNAALRKDLEKLERDRAAKATAEASGDYAKQVKESATIGADKTIIEEKETEKKIDEKILQHDQSMINKNSNAPATMP